MAKITMELIKELREKTQVGMMDCKKALTEADGNIEKAIELLRKKGAAVAQKRAGNETNNGHIESCISADYKSGVLLKIGCETDFSANTQTMKEFAKNVCLHTLNTNPECHHDGTECPECCKGAPLLEQKFYNDQALTIQDKLNELISKISENIKIAEYIRFDVKNHGIITSYLHPGANLGVMIELNTDKEIDSQNIEKVKQLGKDLCMQIAVTNPLSIRPKELDKTTIEKEQEVIKEQLIAQGKPEKMVDKIMQGKLQKFYEEVCLLNQKFIKNDKMTVKQYINEMEKNINLQINVNRFKRFGIGK